MEDYEILLSKFTPGKKGVNPFAKKKSDDDEDPKDVAKRHPVGTVVGDDTDNPDAEKMGPDKWKHGDSEIDDAEVGKRFGHLVKKPKKKGSKGSAKDDSGKPPWLKASDEARTEEMVELSRAETVNHYLTLNG